MTDINFNIVCLSVKNVLFKECLVYFQGMFSLLDSEPSLKGQRSQGSRSKVTWVKVRCL